MPGVAFISDEFHWRDGEGTFPLRPTGIAFYRCVLPSRTLSGRVNVGRPAWTGSEGFGVVTSAESASFFYDTVVIKQLMSRNTVYKMKAAQGLGQRLIVDVDDWFDDIPADNVAYEANDPTKSHVSNRSLFHDVIMQADAVTTSTPFLFDAYSKLRDNVHLVRNCVDPDAMTFREVRNQAPLLGWAGGIPWHGGDVETVREWLPDFLEDYDLRSHHSGHSEVARTFEEVSLVPGSRISTSPMKPLSRYLTESFCFDIGIVPLEDRPFTHAKSALKGLEYAASGIPFVAQATPEYLWLADRGVGRVARTPAEWTQHLMELLDYKTRRREAAMNLTAVKRDHTIASRADAWRAALLG